MTPPTPPTPPAPPSYSDSSPSDDSPCSTPPNSPASPASRTPNPISWFKLQLVFCDTEINGQTYTYDPRSFRLPQSMCPAIFCLDRNASADTNREDLVNLIRILNPRTRLSEACPRKKDMIGVAVNNPPGPRSVIRVTFGAVVAQLRQIDTYGIEVVVPELLGSGGNELHILMRGVTKK